MTSIKPRLVAVGVIPVVLFLALIMFYLLPAVKNAISQEKKNQTREMTNTALGILDHYHQLEQNKVLSRSDAQHRASETIKAMTFGQKKQDYFWINDFHPRMVMHPFRPDLTGEDLSDFQDPEGFHLFKEFVVTVQREGEGHVPYLWQYYDDPTRIEPKLSYVKGFEPWRWIVGTGVYINDVDVVVNEVRNALLLWSLLIFLIILAVVSCIVWSVLRPLLKTVSFANSVAMGKLDEKLKVWDKGEIGLLSSSLNTMVGNLKHMIQRAELKSEEAEEQARTANRAVKEAEIARQLAETAKKGTQQALDSLRESEEKLAALFSSMAEMVVLHEMVFNAQGEAIDYRIIDCNKAFLETMGIKRPDAVGKLATEFYQTINVPFLEQYTRVAAIGESSRFEAYYAPLDKHFSISVVSPGRNRFATISADITANKKMQQLIAAKNKELEQLVYVASHDLRSPLVNVDGYGRELGYVVEDLNRTLDADHDSLSALKAVVRPALGEMTAALGYIKNSTSQMDALLKGLLKLSRSGRTALKVGPLDMNELVAKAVAAIEFQVEESGVDLSVFDLPPCRGDQVQVTQVFSNLLGNALKFLDPQRPGVIRISGLVQEDRCVYCVEDNGIGIDPAHQKNIFEIFHRLDPSKRDGDGLGLTIVRQILERLSGEVWVESSLDQGSRFYVALPAVHGG